MKSIKDILAQLFSTVAVGTAKHDARGNDPRVAFEVVEDGRSSQALFPSRTRLARLESEAQVFVLLFKDFGKAMRYVELHGSLRAEFGSRFNLWTEDILGRSDDELLRLAVADGKNLLYALRNPVTVPVMPELVDSDFAVTVASTDSTPMHPPVPPVAQYVREGVYVYSGPRNWVGPSGQVGRPSFAVVLERDDGGEEVIFGSDLSNALRQSDVRFGDRIRVTKWPRTSVPAGDKIVKKNIFTIDILARAAQSDVRSD